MPQKCGLYMSDRKDYNCYFICWSRAGLGRKIRDQKVRDQDQDQDQRARDQERDQDQGSWSRDWSRDQDRSRDLQHC